MDLITELIGKIEQVANNLKGKEINQEGFSKIIYN